MMLSVEVQCSQTETERITRSLRLKHSKKKRKLNKTMQLCAFSPLGGSVAPWFSERPPAQTSVCVRANWPVTHFQPELFFHG